MVARAEDPNHPSAAAQTAPWVVPWPVRQTVIRSAVRSQADQTARRACLYRVLQMASPCRARHLQTAGRFAAECRGPAAATALSQEPACRAPFRPLRLPVVRPVELAAARA